MKPLVILTGPTAVGKTGLSIKLAKAINAEIISADSAQVYRGLDIGSAKISEAEMDGIRHHLINAHDFDYDYNIAEFKAEANAAIDDILSRDRIPLIVGGTGFYIQAILRDIDFTETSKDEGYRQQLEALAKEKGNAYVHGLLKEIDPAAADEIHENNLKRVIRALEFARETGAEISKHNEEQRQKPSPYNYAYFVLNRDRARLYERIDRRVDIMMEAGLVDEVSSLKAAGANVTMTSMQAIGYKEILSYLDGEISLERAAELIKLASRHLAKRQITWFKREADVNWLDADLYNEDELLKQITTKLQSLNIL